MRLLRACGEYQIAVVCVLVLVILPFWGRNVSEDTDCRQEPIRVAVLATPLTSHGGMDASFYARYRSMMMAALEGRASIVVFPENTLPGIDINEETLLPIAPGMLPQFEDLLLVSRLYPSSTLILGLHTSRGNLHFNSTVMIKGGAIVSIYHKSHLVPFTEFMPFDMPFHTPIFERLTEGGAGSMFVVNDIRTAVLMCSEIAVIGGGGYAGLILSPSNDGVFSSDAVARVHPVYAPCRAIESGAYVLRTSKGGISGIIDPNGNMVAGADSREDAVIFADIAPLCNK